MYKPIFEGTLQKAQNLLPDLPITPKTPVNRAKLVGDMAINLVKGISKQFIYNDETKKVLPSSPYHAVASANAIKDSKERMKAMQDVATNTVMAGTINSPQSVKSSTSTIGKVASKMHPDDIGELDWAMDTIKNKAVTPQIRQQAEEIIGSLQEGYGVVGNKLGEVGKKLQKLAGKETGSLYTPNLTSGDRLIQQLDQSSAKPDLLTEARKYGSAEEFVNNVSKDKYTRWVSDRELEALKNTGEIPPDIRAKVVRLNNPGMLSKGIGESKTNLVIFKNIDELKSGKTPKGMFRDGGSAGTQTQIRGGIPGDYIETVIPKSQLTSLYNQAKGVINQNLPNVPGVYKPNFN